MPTFTPQTWQPPSAPKLTGEFATNDRLDAATLIGLPVVGPEDVVADDHGNLFTGVEDGSILRVEPTGRITTLADVGGRPLGIEWYGQDLLVCNADLGLQLVSPTGAIEVLTDTFNGVPLVLTNNASVASDGSVYFTESSQRWPLEQYTADLLEGQPSGRLLRRAPDGALTVLVEGLQFANGVALDATEGSVFVAETGRYRIHRHRLSGDGAGTTEIFVDNLPGFPDNLTFGDGILWVAHASPRQAMIDVMAPRAWMRSLAHRMPEPLKPKPVRHGMVFGYDERGAVRHNLQDQSGRVAITTSARFHDGRLLIGMLSDPHLAVVGLD